MTKQPPMTATRVPVQRIRTETGPFSISKVPLDYHDEVLLIVDYPEGTVVRLVTEEQSRAVIDEILGPGKWDRYWSQFQVRMNNRKGV